MRLSKKEQKIVELIQGHGIIRARDLNKLNCSRTILFNLCKKGVLKKLGRGLYTHVDNEFDENQSTLEVCKHAPDAIVCLLSALSFHKFTTQNPFEVWIALQAGAWTPKMDYPPIRVFRFSKKSFSVGFKEYDIDGVKMKVYVPAKTIADCFKFRNKIGLDVALEALHEGWRKKLFTMDELYKYGEICKVNKVMKPYLESL